MDDKNLYNESFYGDELPINIPSPDEAWNDMRERLKKEKKYGAPWWVAGFLMAGLLLLVVVGIDMSKKRAHNTNSAVENINPKKIIDSEKKNNAEKNHTDAKPEGSIDVGNNVKEISPETVSQSSPLSGVASNNISNNKSSVHSHKKRKVKGTNTASLKPPSSKDTNDAAAAINQVVPDNQQTDLMQEKNNNKDTIKNDLNKKTTVINKPFLSDSLKSDSVAEKNQDDEKGFTTEAGLHWTAQLPFANAETYFTGPNTKAQPYRMLLPGLWLTLHSERTLLSIEVNPFYSVLVPNKSFKTSTFSSTASDTITRNSTTETLNKLFGISAGIGYDYNIIGKWWIGGNVQADWWRKAIATSKTEENRKSLSGSFDDINMESSARYALGDSAWESFSKFQIKLSLEILYKQQMWQAGLRGGFPITPLAKDAGPVNPFCAELFFRLRLWTNEKKKKE